MAQSNTETIESLKEVCDHVYYNPPASIQLVYPCIIVQLDDVLHGHANGKVYKRDNRYSLTIIDTNPDSELRAAVDDLPMTSMNRSYVADGLWHFAYTMFN